MTARTHDAFAIASLMTATVVFPPPPPNITTAILCLVANVVGCLIPDMDQASNRLWDLLPAGNFIGKILRRLFLGHRTISHSLLGLFLYYKFFDWLTPRVFNANFLQTNLIFACLMIGIVSHLIADFITKEGLPLFFPLPYKIGFPPIKAFRVRTDSWVEHIVILPLVVCYMIVLANENREVLLGIIRSITK
jgi:inner membrane protein